MAHILWAYEFLLMFVGLRKSKCKDGDGERICGGDLGKSPSSAFGNWSLRDLLTIQMELTHEQLK